MRTPWQKFLFLGFVNASPCTSPSLPFLRTFFASSIPPSVPSNKKMRRYFFKGHQHKTMTFASSWRLLASEPSCGAMFSIDNVLRPGCEVVHFRAELSFNTMPDLYLQRTLCPYRYVPVSVVIISVIVSSRASPKSVSFSFLRFVVSKKLSAHTKLLLGHRKSIRSVTEQLWHKGKKQLLEEATR